MARRRQLKGIAGNLSQWVISRNFDIQGYWALGQFYKHVEHKNSKTIVIDLMQNTIVPEPENEDLDTALKMLSYVLIKDLKSNKISSSWLKEVKILFVVAK